MTHSLEELRLTHGFLGVRPWPQSIVEGKRMQLRNVAYVRVKTPLGMFIVAARDAALKGGWFEGQKYFPEINADFGWHEDETSVLHAARQQLDAYFAGTSTDFQITLAPEGTEFQQQVWSALRAVPWGETTTYAALARALGRPAAFHPVGAAVGRNPLSLFIPCHRALGSNGSLTGYAGGLERKRWLLDHEGRERSLFD
ncbi:MAG: methylated-DNA--[protein]-cysteine S-methyltransferase [Rhodanobacter sp.]